MTRERVAPSTARARASQRAVARSPMPSATAAIARRFDIATLPISHPSEAVQLDANPGASRPSPAHIHRVASAGVRGAGQPLPHRARLERAFGPAHDLSLITAHIGGAAGHASARLGANGYAIGNHVAFRAAPDLRLAAHEAAHVIQQRGGVQLDGGVGRAGDAYERHADAVADRVVRGESVAEMFSAGRAAGAPSVQMQLAHTQHPSRPQYPSRPRVVNAAVDPRALAAIENEVVELRGAPSFSPSYWLEQGLRAFMGQSVAVRARFGAMASGVLRVRVQPALSMHAPDAPPAVSYESETPHEALELTHPSFPGDGLDGRARLEVQVANNIVSGKIELLSSRALPEDATAAPDLARQLGWRGLQDVVGAPSVNELRNGVLRYEIPRFQFGVSDETVLDATVFRGRNGFAGTGSFSVTDDRERFAAELDIEADGIAAGELPLRKTALGISGASRFALALRPRDLYGGAFAGTVAGTFAGGRLVMQGVAHYRSRRASGDLTVLVAPRALAWKHVEARLGSSRSTKPKASAGAGYVIVGWGTADFALNDWLTGSASAVLDPDGYITSFGVLRPVKQFQFLTDHERWSRVRQLGPVLTGSVQVLPVAGLFGVYGYAEARLFASGRVGPGRIYDLEIEGRVSTRPGTLLQARARGRVHLEAWGRLSTTLRGGLTFSLAGDTARVGEVAIQGEGAATLRTYAELQPSFERIADPAHLDQANFQIAGTLTAAAAADLGLKGQIVIRLLGKDIRTIDLARYQWNIGSIGLSARFAHVVGSHKPIELGFESADFDDKHFSTVIEKLINERGQGNDAQHDVKLPAANAAPRAEIPTALAHSFRMNGADHRLWIEHEPNAVIKMASSGKGDLADKLRAEIAVVDAAEHQQIGGVAAALREEEAQAARLLAQTVAVERSLDTLQSESFNAGDVAGLRELADGLTSYGAQYNKTDLATVPPAAGTAVSVEIADGRYIVTNRTQLEAVRAIAPRVDAPSADLEPALSKIWTDYVAYFQTRIAKLDRQLAAKAELDDGPQIWPAYVDTRRQFDGLRAAKDFQPELRNLILADRPNLSPKHVEIDVGVRATRRGIAKTTRYADVVVVVDVANENVEIYSAKVHNVRSAAASRNDRQVAQWIREVMSKDTDEAANSYGYEVEFRRPRASDAQGRLGDRTSPRHVLFERRVYVNRVHLVWKYDSSLIPARFLEIIEREGARLGMIERAGSKVKVDFLLRPQPPDEPLP